jgi:uncharacterized membrane protein (UPF0127 family)
MTVARFAVAIALCAIACASRTPDAAAAQPSRVIVETRAGARHAVRVEIARTFAERARGLMERRELAQDAGMLFIFDETSDHAFWMKNTLIPLDMIFAGEDGRIVGIVARAVPGDLTGRSVGAPSRYVLEVNGGWAQAHGVAPGDRLKFENVGAF